MAFALVKCRDTTGVSASRDPFAASVEHLSMISSMIYLAYYLFFNPFPWASLGGFLEGPYSFFQALGL